MTWTRDVLVARARHLANTEDATGDWPADVVLDHASTVHQQEWGHLLDMNPRLRMARRVVTVSADGTFNRDGLSTPTQRLERLVLLMPGTPTLLEMVRYWDARVGRITGVQWQRIGDEIVVEQASSQTLTALVTHVPPLVRDLVDGMDTSGAPVSPSIEWPDGWEMLLAYETAAAMLTKGARESEAAVDLQNEAEKLRQRMLARLGRDRTSPLVVTATDQSSDWGGC